MKLPLQTSHQSVLNLFNTTLCNKSRGERIRLRKLGEISTTGVKEEKGLGKECGVRERLRGECHDVTCHADTVDDTLERLFVYIIQIGQLHIYKKLATHFTSGTVQRVYPFYYSLMHTFLNLRLIGQLELVIRFQLIRRLRNCNVLLFAAQPQ